MIKIIHKIFQNIILIFFILFLSNCSQNFEPIINSITAIPNPAQPGDKVILKCIATDDDEENILKNELLVYQWYAAFGELSTDNSDSALWIAPEDEGEYSITCSVSDQYNGLDILAISITVK